MSLFRLPQFCNLASGVDRIRDRFLGRRADSGVTERAFRRLAVDALEERHLLSVSPMGPVDHLVNQSFVGDLGDEYQVFENSQMSKQSVATDDDGDFVVTWTRYDYVIDPDTGDYVIDVNTNQPMVDANIYARYFTDETQRVTLPSELAVNNLAGNYGRFSMTVGGNEVQKLTISSTPLPYWPEDFRAGVVGSFSVGFDVNGDGVVGAGESFTMFYDETTMEQNERQLETGLRGLGGSLSDVKVDAVAPGEFNIYFGNQSGGQNMPEIVIDPTFTTWTAGFYPGAMISTVSEPITINNIPVHPTDAWQTASAIEQWFYGQAGSVRDVHQSPTEFLWSPEYSYTEPDTVRYAQYRVSAMPVIDPATGQYSLTTFDITFVGESGKKDIDEMVVAKATNDLGVNYLGSSQLDVTTIKQPSPEFRVNDLEPDDPFTPWPDRTNQVQASVAMDADGDFVITWTSYNSGVNNLNISDIYARRFSPTSYVENPDFVLDDGTKVHGVQPQGNAFRVNTFTNGRQDDPSIGMDPDGNFTIAWVSTAQDISYFNEISAQRYDRDGSRFGGEFVVVDSGDATDTNIHYDPFVSMSPEGHILVTWTQTVDVNYLSDGFTRAADVHARWFEPGIVYYDPEDWTTNFAWEVTFWVDNSDVFMVDRGWESSSAFDSNNNFVISYTSNWDIPVSLDVFSRNSDNVYAIMYAPPVVEVLTVDDEQVMFADVQVLREQLRVNSASLPIYEDGTFYDDVRWSGPQYNGRVLLDADGDLTGIYEGFGPDVGEGVVIASQFFTNLISSEKNADLLPYFNPAAGMGLFAEGTPELPGQIGDTTDVDTVIEYVLVNAVNAGATTEQVGRLSVILNSVATMLRGDANGIFFSSFDATWRSQPQIVANDSVVNAQRDGENARYILQLDSDAISGSIQLQLGHGVTGQVVNINVALPYLPNNGPLNADRAALIIEDAIERAVEALSLNTPYWPDSVFAGTVSVRRIDNIQENFDRMGTDWAWPNNFGFFAAYEINFSGDCHDMLISLGVTDSDMKLPGDIDAAFPISTGFSFGSNGTVQSMPSAAMQPDGDFVVAWTQYDRYTNGSTGATNIYFREFNESTDTAGPKVTDFLLADGQRLTNGGQVIDNMEYIVVTFDERLATSGTHSVTNLANWSLMKDGVKVSGGVSNVLFGMNMSTTLGLNSLGSNKWEAVVFFDGNGVTAGTPSLGGGNYEIVASNAIRDTAGNSLNRTGYLVNGASVSRSFSLVPPIGSETQVNTGTSGNQVVMDDAGMSPDTIPNSPRAIAGDVDGDYVVVWTDQGSSPGVWAKVLRTEWSGTAANRVSNTVTVKEFRITDNPTASYASVAVDGDGDFVVTWSQWDPETEWDVWFQRFDGMGRALDVARMANTETELSQHYASVAMDNDGDFIITWQSEGQDGNGYGVYAQRYTRAGEIVGGIDEIQVLSFDGDISVATFTLDFDGLITSEITYNGDIYATAAQVEAAMLAIGIEVDAVPLNGTDLAIQFLGEHGRRDVPPLVLNHSAVAGSGQIRVIMALEGIGSEFRVNDTVGGSQVFPSVAMDATGDYIVTWTSFGQDGDAAYQSNIYAKRFGAGEELVSPTQRLARLAENWNWTAPMGTEVVPFMVTTDDPDNHVVFPGQGFDGVAMLMMSRTDGDGLGSGVLLPSGYHILTAAHNVADDFGNMVATNVEVIFWINDEPWVAVVDSSAIYVHPDYNGSPWSGGADLAVLVLQERAPDIVERWDIYRDGEEVGQNFHKFGYGRWGEGDQGDVNPPDGWMRHGWNTWEATGDMLAQVLGEHYSSDGLMYDFDDGDEYDTFGTIFGMPHAGLGNNEICGAPGDSGGPNFIGNRIAGITSYGIVIGQPDPVPGLNSSFSDIGVDQRVSTYADWVDAMTRATPEFLVNTTTIGDQKWSSVAMDANGDYVITWTSYNQDGTGSGPGAGFFGENGIFAQRFTAGNIPVGDEFQANTFTEGNQQHSQVAMDADGDFMITWESFQDRPAAGSGPDAGVSYGVYAQRYAANHKLNDPFVGVNGRIGNEIHVNTTTTGNQRFPSVFLNYAGDAVITWSGPGIGDSQGVFTQRFEVVKDLAGPVVTDVLAPSSGVLDPIIEDEAVGSEIGYLVVRFGENLSTQYSTSGATSIVNPGNWSLSRFGTTVNNAINTVQFGLNKAYELGLDSLPSGKYEAVVRVDGDPNTTGIQPLRDGSYTLNLSQNVTDLFDNRLDGDHDGTPGGAFAHSFQIQLSSTVGGDIPVVAPGAYNSRTQPETPNAVASDADGDHVIVWTATVNVGGREIDKVYGQRFDANGTPQGNAFEITPAQFSAFGLDDQRHASVAMDADGDFIVTWTNYRDTNGDGVNNEADIYARRYRANGTAMNDPILVNTYTANAQKWSDVAMDADGDFVIVWSSRDQEGNGQPGHGYGVYARRFDSFGTPLGAEFHVNVTTVGNQRFPSVAMSAGGNFIVAWTSDQAVNGSDIVARAFKANGSPMPIDNSLAMDTQPIGIFGGEILVNTTTAGDQLYADVAIDMTGENFIVAWTSWGQDTSGAGVYARLLLMNPFGYVVPDPRDPYEFRVNSTVTGNQFYPSVAMAWDGSYIVSWSGYGNRPSEMDTSDYGVFYQRFDPFSQPIGGEHRANSVTQGNQWLPSVAMDANGNFIVAWTGVGETLGTTEVYRFVGKNRFPKADTTGPIITDVLAGDNRSRLIEGASIQVASDLKSMVFIFNENLSTQGGVAGMTSVLNPQNWVLIRNGTELLMGVSQVTFSYNNETRKYEAVVTFDSNGMNPGSPGLIAGEYSLILRESVTDVVGNRLDGEYDAVPGTLPSSSGRQGFAFNFSVSDTPSIGPDHRVNETTTYEQTFSPVLGMGMALEYSNRSVAVDNDGDFVVVWTSYGQDDPSDPSGAGVYMRMYDRNGVSLTGDVRVNTITQGHQRNAEVAMDADGDFVIVWESESANGTIDIYSQRFTAAGNRVPNERDARIIDDPYRDLSGEVLLGGAMVPVTQIETLVNSATIGDQTKPSVAMNNIGEFVVIYTSSFGRDFGFFQQIMGQRFDMYGVPLGDEFQVNEESIPLLPTVAYSRTTSNSSVAIAADGSFVATWEQFTRQTDGVIFDSVIVARMFDADGEPVFFFDDDDEETPIGSQFRVDYSDLSADDVGETFTDPEHREPQSAVDVWGPTDIRRTARNPQIAMDGQGNFTIVWESWRDNDIDEDDDGTGDVGGPDTDDHPDSYGIYFHQFNADGTSRINFDYNANMVNTMDAPEWDPHFTGAQVNPSLAMDIDGNLAVVWNGLGAEPDPLYSTDPALISNFDETGVFMRYFSSSAGPNSSVYTSQQKRVNYASSGVQQFPTIGMTPDGDSVVVWSGAGVGDQHGIFFRRYNESADWVGPLATELRLGDGEKGLIGPEENIFGNPETLLVVFDEEMDTSTGANGLPGRYSIENVDNWALVNGSGNEIPGVIHSVDFYFDAELNKWVAAVTFSDPSGNPVSLINGTYTLVIRTTARDVAGNPMGRTGYLPNGPEGFVDVRGQEILLGDAPSPTGGIAFQFKVNNTHPGAPSENDIDEKITDNVVIVGQEGVGQIGYHDSPDVARNASGDYVVVWVSYSEIIDGTALPFEGDEENLPIIPTEPILETNIMAQRFTAAGRANGDPILVNSFTEGIQIEPAVAIDDAGNFVVVWSGAGIELGDESGIFGQRFDADGKSLGGQFRVNQYTTSDTYGANSPQDEPAVAMNPNNGDFVVTWTSFEQDGNMDGVYGRRYLASGLAVGGEFLVNATTAGSQSKSAVAMDGMGNFVVSWQSEHDTSGLGVYAQRFDNTGARRGGEFRVNTYRTGDQDNPSVAMDRQGNFVVVWASRQDGSGYGVYGQIYREDGVKVGGEFRVNQTTVHDQYHPDVSMTSTEVDGQNFGFAVTWTSFNQDSLSSEANHRDYGIYARMYNLDGSDFIHAGIGPEPIGEFRVNAQTVGDQYSSAVSMDADGHYVVVWVGVGDSVDSFELPPEGSEDEEPIPITIQMPAIYSRYIDPPIQDPIVSTQPTELVLTGTADDDVFEFVGGPTAGTWVVKLNGILQYVPSTITTVLFDGLGGSDTVVFTGSAAADTVEMWPTRGVLSSADYTVVAENVSTITTSGGGGTDSAVLHDSAGDDTFIGRKADARLTGAGFDLHATDFENVEVRSEAGGYDQATLYDSTGDDVFTASYQSAALTDGAYSIVAKEFNNVRAYATEGGSNTSNFLDSPGNDRFESTAGYAQMRDDASTYYLYAEGFDRMVAVSSAGGVDNAKMYGSDGDDLFRADRTYAQFQGDGFYCRADSFPFVLAYGLGGTDTARLYDSAGDDTFVAGPNYGALSGDGYKIQVDSFRYVTGYGSQGNDLAILYDSAGNDTLLIAQEYAQLSSDQYFNRAHGFRNVNVFGREENGGYDQAVLYDSTMADHLEAADDWVRLSNDQFNYWACCFESVVAKSKLGGDDTKDIASELDFVLAMEGDWRDL